MAVPAPFFIKMMIYEPALIVIITHPVKDLPV
jgi:hypothetical protein